MQRRMRCRPFRLRKTAEACIPPTARLHAHPIVGRAAFRLPRDDGGATFVDERFVELVKSANLRGLDLTLAWESVAD